MPRTIHLKTAGAHAQLLLLKVFHVGFRRRRVLTDADFFRENEKRGETRIGEFSW
jgi:hypothetical protein